MCDNIVVVGKQVTGTPTCGSSNPNLILLYRRINLMPVTSSVDYYVMSIYDNNMMGRSGKG